MIAICTYATRRYSYALEACLRRIAAAINEPATLIFVHDGSPILKLAQEICARFMPTVKLEPVLIRCESDDLPNYKIPAQLLIARMQEAAFAHARSLGAEWCWSVESDVLVPPDAFTLSHGILQGFGDYYDIAMVTYPNGDFLGGRGQPDFQIMPVAYPDERDLPEKLREELKTFAPKKGEKPDKTMARWSKIQEQVDKCPHGNVWQLTAQHGWRRRGWLSWAYPAIGRGAVLPTDWVGLGCTLLSKKALAVATFEGYEGAGTQDLFLCWKRWHPAGLRSCVITHTVASHVVRNQKPDGTFDFKSFTLQEASHEQGGEYDGHLRIRAVPWVVDGETSENGTRQQNPLLRKSGPSAERRPARVR